ncbi:CHAT domain-containing protein [Lactifluus volemus]|nr:CHAT domain-containing protein [Lactifluus volemus]
MEAEKPFLSKIEEEIDTHQIVLSSLPRFHPRRAEFLKKLAMWRFEHFKISASRGQLDQSILHWTEIILLLRSGPTLATAPSALRILAIRLRLRWQRFNQPDDIKNCVNYHRYLRDQRLQDVYTSHDIITSDLVRALGEQVESQSRSDNIMENIKEMMILCLELLNSDNLPLATGAFASLIEVIAKCHYARREFQDKGIECLREATIRFPSSRHLLYFLGRLLVMRFYENGFANDDYSEAIASLNRAITLASDLPEDTEIDRLIVQGSLWMIASASFIRSTIFGHPEYLEEAIHHNRRYLSSSWVPLDDPRRVEVSRTLAVLVDRRILFTSYPGFSDPDPSFDLSTLSSLTESIPEPNSWTSDQWNRHYQPLGSIYAAIVNGSEIVENEEILKYCRKLADSRRRVSSSNLPLGPSLPFLTLSKILVHAFKSTDKIEYLDESIAVLRDGLKTRYKWPAQQLLINSLISSLTSRLYRLERREDLKDLMQLFVKAVDDTSMMKLMRFDLSRAWAKTAHVFNHPSVTTAYEKAFSLLQDYLFYSPTLETQHSRLVSMHVFVGDLTSEYASYQVDTGQLNRAIETLERGRALLWSEMRSFRTSTDRLAAVDLALAEEFVAINSKLEQVTTSIVPYGITQREGSGGEGSGRLDSFGPLVEKRQKLVDDREKLISRIRALPDLDNFLKPPSFDALRSAALRGPVIITNSCKFRSDILILFHNSPPSLITTADDFHDRALQLGDRLVKDRKKYSLESKQYQKALRSVLKDLYELVGRSVVEEFRKMKIEEQSRVWWCPTSVFCHLPLHAMGPIPSDDGVKRYFSDLYISSYTPTLSALIESRKSAGSLGGQSSSKPSILLVAQPESLRYAIPEIWTIQRLDATVTSLISKEATPRSVVESLRNHQFSHFVCHGSLERGKPLDASLRLYEGESLTLLDIVRSQLPSAEFAFLSACHTAELTEESIDDEALHLAAAMQYCGFRSVVGTMWATVDQGGQTLIKDFYKILLSSDEPGVPYHERSARALWDAVRNLRREGASLEQWVNYVHYGA